MSMLRLGGRGSSPKNLIQFKKFAHPFDGNILQIQENGRLTFAKQFLTWSEHPRLHKQMLWSVLVFSNEQIALYGCLGFFPP